MELDRELLSHMLEAFMNYVDEAIVDEDLGDMLFTPRLLPHPKNGYVVLEYLGDRRKDTIKHIEEDCAKSGFIVDASQPIVEIENDIDEDELEDKFEEEFGEPITSVEAIFDELYKTCYVFYVETMQHLPVQVQEKRKAKLEEMKRDLYNKFLA